MLPLIITAIFGSIVALGAFWGGPWGLSRSTMKGASAALALLALASGAGLTVTAVSGEPTRAGAFRFDALAFFSLFVLSIIAFAVYRYSLSYLAGDAAQVRFLGTMSRTVAATTLFVVADHLALIGVLWIAMSFGMHSLLRHFNSRATARKAANKKFWFSRVGDLCFWTATALLASQGLSLVPSEWSPAVLAGHQLTLAALLMTTGVLLKSAQFPFHTWLPETMEAPTPVSAFMHAGVVNAGALLLLRSTPLLAAAPRALDLALVAGGITAAVGCIVWWTQNNTKLSLAWSTIAQMGFLFIELGLGLYAAAVLHLLGHALYKAHAFLRSGTLPHASAAPSKSLSPEAAVTAFLLLGAFGFYGQRWLGPQWQSEVVLAFLWAFVGLEVSKQTADSAFARVSVVALVFASFVGVQSLSGALLSGFFQAAPTLTERGIPSLIAAATAVTALSVAGAWLVAPTRLKKSSFSHAFHVHALNGFYLGTVATLVHYRITSLFAPKDSHA